jgi:hypothetical protein
MRQRVLKDVVDQGGEASINGERIHKFLEDRLKTNTSLPQEVKDYEPLCQAVERMASKGQLYIEQEATLNQQLEPTGWWDDDAWLRSKLDILVIIGDNAVVMDWKTGKRNPDMFQMLMFAAQVFKHYPNVQTVKTSLVWLKVNKMDNETYTRADIPQLWEEILKRINRIEKAEEHNVWPAKPSGLCRFCPVRHDCNFAKI